MAFARIITRSHQYAEKLALDLLARGYAVEIVSPDAIPETPADLELRVEAGDPFGPLTPQSGQVKASDYVQRLKPMMADLLRKWPASKTQADQERLAEFRFDEEQEQSADIEVPSPHYRKEAAEIPPEVKGVEFHESARLVPTPRPSMPELSAFSITGEPISWSDSESEKPFRSDTWFWRAAVGFAGVAVIILVFGMALRKPPVSASATTSAAQTEAAKIPTAPLSTPPVTATVASINPKATMMPVAAPTALTVNKSKPSPVVRGTSKANLKEVVRGDTTVTYFKDKRPEPAKSVAKPESGIKHYSDLN